MATKVLVVYYSLHGHVEARARAVAAGAESVRNTAVRLRRVPDLADEKPLERPVDAATLDDLRWADGIAWGTVRGARWMRQPTSRWENEAMTHG